MRIIKPSSVRAYAAKHPTAREPLSAWLLTTSRADWHSLADVRRTYPHADSLLLESGNTVTIFNIAGNTYRLIVAIHYNARRVYIRDFMTHAEYNKEAWKGRH